MSAPKPPGQLNERVGARLVDGRLNANTDGKHRITILIMIKSNEKSNVEDCSSTC